MCENNENEIQKTNQQTELAQIDPNSPAGIMERLMNKDGTFDVEGFGKMMEFQERHEANQARKAYHVAMANFLADAPKIIKQKDGHNCKYAGLSDIVVVIAPLLSKHGLSHSWVTGTADKDITVTCKITHILGHSEETSLSAGPDTSGSKNAIQAVGSTITYLERYTLKAALGLAEGDQDDDGAGADDKKTKEIPKPNKKEQAFIDAVLEKLPPVEGKVYNAERLGKYLYALRENNYCSDMTRVNEAAEAVVKKGTPELYMDDTNLSQFEIDNKLPGDEDSRPGGDMPLK